MSVVIPRESPATPAQRVLPALAQRLRAASEVLLDGCPDASGDDRRDSSVLLDQLVRHAQHAPDDAPLWLLWTAVAAAFPSPADVVAARRALELHDSTGATAWLLEACFEAARTIGSPGLEMDVVVGQVIVDVDFCARHDLHTGIQRVVRETLPRWERDHELIMVAWTDRDGGFRGLAEAEVHNVLRWGTAHEPSDAPSTDPHRLVVPWRCSVVLPESTEAQRTQMLAAIALHSGNTLGAIGYDCIPVVSPDLVHPALPDRFAQYLTAIKHVHRVAGISRSATAEFEGFAAMLRSQGLPGPTVSEVQLPVEVPDWVTKMTVERADPPLVVSVGSFEPRKNQLALMHAAERLWREGLRFDLLFIGGGGWRTEFDSTFKRLQSAGRPIRRRTAVRDQELWRAYREARITVFPSLHEGYGLPVAESLACGTPVITSGYGSTREIAEGGGALLVDPRNDDALTDVLRRALLDDALVERLGEQALARASRTWDDYAWELWQELADPTVRPTRGDRA